MMAARGTIAGRSQCARWSLGQRFKSEENEKKSNLRRENQRISARFVSANLLPSEYVSEEVSRGVPGIPKAKRKSVRSDRKPSNNSADWKSKSEIMNTKRTKNS